MSSHIKLEIAEAAARLIADGESDYATAKRKAAAALGHSTREPLPDNLDVEDALRTHYALFVPSHAETLAALREEAMEWMQRLANFSPWLSGPVLTGTANEYTPITLEIVGCDMKAFDIWLINQHIEYDCTQRAKSTVYTLDDDGLIVNVLLFDSHAQRQAAFPASSIHHARVQIEDARTEFASR